VKGVIGLRVFGKEGKNLTPQKRAPVHLLLKPRKRPEEKEFRLLNYIELVDGDLLVQLFENLQLGLIPRTTYKVDEKFFDEFKD